MKLLVVFLRTSLLFASFVTKDICGTKSVKHIENNQENIVGGKIGIKFLQTRSSPLRKASNRKNHDEKFTSINKESEKMSKSLEQDIVQPKQMENKDVWKVLEKIRKRLQIIKNIENKIKSRYKNNGAKHKPVYTNIDKRNLKTKTKVRRNRMKNKNRQKIMVMISKNGNMISMKRFKRLQSKGSVDGIRPVYVKDAKGGSLFAIPVAKRLKNKNYILSRKMIMVPKDMVQHFLKQYHVQLPREAVGNHLKFDLLSLEEKYNVKSTAKAQSVNRNEEAKVPLKHIKGAIFDVRWSNLTDKNYVAFDKDNNPKPGKKKSKDNSVMIKTNNTKIIQGEEADREFFGQFFKTFHNGLSKKDVDGKQKMVRYSQLKHLLLIGNMKQTNSTGQRKYALKNTTPDYTKIYEKVKTEVDKILRTVVDRQSLKPSITNQTVPYDLAVNQELQNLFHDLKNSNNSRLLSFQNLQNKIGEKHNNQILSYHQTPVHNHKTTQDSNTTTTARPYIKSTMETPKFWSTTLKTYNANSPKTSQENQSSSQLTQPNVVYPQIQKNSREIFLQNLQILQHLPNMKPLPKINQVNPTQMNLPAIQTSPLTAQNLKKGPSLNDRKVRLPLTKTQQQWLPLINQKHLYRQSQAIQRKLTLPSDQNPQKIIPTSRGFSSQKKKGQSAITKQISSNTVEGSSSSKSDEVQYPTPSSQNNFLENIREVSARKRLELSHMHNHRFSSSIIKTKYPTPSISGIADIPARADQRSNLRAISPSNVSQYLNDSGITGIKSQKTAVDFLQSFLHHISTITHDPQFWRNQQNKPSVSTISSKPLSLELKRNLVLPPIAEAEAGGDGLQNIIGKVFEDDDDGDIDSTDNTNQEGDHNQGLKKSNYKEETATKEDVIYIPSDIDQNTDRSIDEDEINDIQKSLHFNEDDLEDDLEDSTNIEERPLDEGLTDSEKSLIDKNIAKGSGLITLLLPEYEEVDNKVGDYDFEEFSTTYGVKKINQLPKRRTENNLKIPGIEPSTLHRSDDGMGDPGIEPSTLHRSNDGMGDVVLGKVYPYRKDEELSFNEERHNDVIHDPDSFSELLAPLNSELEPDHKVGETSSYSLRDLSDKLDQIEANSISNIELGTASEKENEIQNVDEIDEQQLNTNITKYDELAKNVTSVSSNSGDDDQWVNRSPEDAGSAKSHPESAPFELIKGVMVPEEIAKEVNFALFGEGDKGKNNNGKKKHVGIARDIFNETNADSAEIKSTEKELLADEKTSNNSIDTSSNDQQNVTNNQQSDNALSPTIVIITPLNQAESLLNLTNKDNTSVLPSPNVLETSEKAVPKDNLEHGDGANSKGFENYREAENISSSIDVSPNFNNKTNNFSMSDNYTSVEPNDFSPNKENNPEEMNDSVVSNNKTSVESKSASVEVNNTQTEAKNNSLNKNISQEEMNKSSQTNKSIPLDERNLMNSTSILGEAKSFSQKNQSTFRAFSLGNNSAPAETNNESNNMKANSSRQSRKIGIPLERKSSRLSSNKFTAVDLDKTSPNDNESSLIGKIDSLLKYVKTLQEINEQINVINNNRRSDVENRDWEAIDSRIAADVESLQD